MASHRKPRAPRHRTAGALGLTTAALTSVALLSQTAQAAPQRPAAPKPSLEEVQKKVDRLYREAGTATQKYNAAQERTRTQRAKVDKLLDGVAERADKLNAARGELGAFAAAQYRSGGMSETATLLLADDPQSWFDQSQLMNRLTQRQKAVVDDYRTQQAAAGRERAKAARQLESLTESQRTLKDSKREVQAKLTEARTLLSELTAEEKARLAEIERKKQAEAERKAKERAKQEEAEREAREAAEEKEREEAGSGGAGSGSGPGTGSGGGSTAPGSSYAAKAEKVIAFARAQMGKPYVWGAAGPDSFDCSGLTQAAWKTAGISLPRTTWDQVGVGQKVSVDAAQPGDLVFFYDDISHVGIYIGGGEMIHAPKPGADVRVESIYYMPIHSVVRPA
ncbi:MULTISPECIES: C40 family peptidase [Streptomyces]|uniref:Glycoside hydrolase n=3 Tax=Streptomyces diastaticus group TaxID=2849069 RepID=A0A8H9HFX9_9ACTN|nr:MULTISPECIES: C40 family peptidase [Streptomyces]NEE26906.1 glycoside hydrolase [Streptomyces sp. SID7982]NEE59201.1 glycoside hydrolase [Streptomyces sp. SID8455]MDQ0295208.1 cell wall-associated NlpC family hydrolase [Streptomyces sp. DSM 41037]PJM84695.1 glycoside hydrolase [Streptomyces sp. TSRI0384-2]QNE81446.1 glycoside hydrolase [Streptomyces rutgersensis]